MTSSPPIILTLALLSTTAHAQPAPTKPPPRSAPAFEKRWTFTPAWTLLWPCWLLFGPAITNLTFASNPTQGEIDGTP